MIESKIKNWIQKIQSKIQSFLAILIKEKPVMADLRYFTFLKGCNEVIEIVDIIYQKLAYILRFYQNHKKVTSVKIKIWKCLEYDNLIPDFNFFPTV